jgi:hypothetical protein
MPEEAPVTRAVFRVLGFVMGRFPIKLRAQLIKLRAQMYD